MSFQPFEVTTPHVAYACLGGFIVLFGMFSLFLREKLYIGEACWAFIFGIVIGPYGAGIFDPRAWGGGNEDTTNIITLEFTRVVLAIGVFAIGVELPKAYMARHWKSIFFLLGPVMTWGWFVSAGFIYALIPGLNFLSSLVVAACLTPTDPILAAAVVGGKYADKHVPAHLRHLLAAESGCNDGAAFPFLFIALYLITDKPSTGTAIKDWFLLLWLYQVVLGIVIGTLLGFGFRYLMKFCERRDLIDRHSYVAQYVSLAFLTIGVTTLLGSDDLLSAFVCGTAFAWDGFFNRQTEESVFSSVIDLLFNIATFIFVGAWMPFRSFQDAELTLTVWRLIVLAILIFLFRRLPIMIALYRWIPDVKTFREAVFSGHFGPIGIGAIFISTLAAEFLHNNASEDNEQDELLRDSIQPIIAFMVLCSITIHGLSIPSFSLGRRVHSVSRTWSRHTGAGAPDWTNQARHVNRGEDIVINRDEVDGMERGEVTASQEEKVDTGSTAASGGSGEKKDMDHEGGERGPMDREENGEVDGEVGMPAGEEPPDGSEIIGEWVEGPHKIIERRAGPGEEVEVEVIRNFEGDGASSLISGSHGSVHRHLGAHMDKLRTSLGHDAEKIGAAIHDDLQVLENKAKVFASSSTSPTPPSKQPASNTNEGQTDEDEEGWASDRSGGGASTSGSTSQVAADMRRRSKSPKTKPAAPKLGSAPLGRKRRRGSIRRGLLGTAQQLMHPHNPERPDSPSITIEDYEERGRTSGSIDFGASGSGGSKRHSRIDSIRASYPPSPRSASPARSIRFADDAPRSPRAVEGALEEDLESPRTHVAFDLPPGGSSAGVKR